MGIYKMNKNGGKKINLKEGQIEYFLEYLMNNNVKNFNVNWDFVSHTQWHLLGRKVKRWLWPMYYQFGRSLISDHFMSLDFENTEMYLLFYSSSACLSSYKLPVG